VNNLFGIWKETLVIQGKSQKMIVSVLTEFFMGIAQTQVDNFTASANLLCLVICNF
jgi:hypothetical protein